MATDTIDHFMWAAPELEAACVKFEKLTSVRPTFGGTHPGRGTHNALAGLGNDRYIEVLAPDPEQAVDEPIARQISLLKKPAIFAFHVRCENLDTAAAIYREVGINCTGPFAIERQCPNGHKLRWRLLIPGESMFGRAIPIFIDWMDAPHPAESAPKGCQLKSFEVGHPKQTELLNLYARLNIGIPVNHSSQAHAEAIIETPKGTVALIGEL